MMRFYKIILPVIIIAVAGIIFISCKKDTGKTVQTCNAPGNPSFSKDIIPLFTANCSLSGCHSGSNPTGNLNLEASNAYANLIKKGRGYVDTINPGNSLLYSQMISTSDPMPPTGKLDDCKTSMILKWMQQKAKNN